MSTTKTFSKKSFPTEFTKNNYILMMKENDSMKYPLSEKYNTPQLMSKIMGPNPIKLEEELLLDCKIPKGAVVCDLGSGQGLTSVFLAKEYGFKVYAADLWSDPDENRSFFREMGSALTDWGRRNLSKSPLFLRFSAVFVPASKSDTHHGTSVRFRCKTVCG